MSSDRHHMALISQIHLPHKHPDLGAGSVSEPVVRDHVVLGVEAGVASLSMLLETRGPAATRIWCARQDSNLHCLKTRWCSILLSYERDPIVSLDRRPSSPLRERIGQLPRPTSSRPYRPGELVGSFRHIEKRIDQIAMHHSRRPPRKWPASMWGCGEEGTDAGLGHWGLWQRSEYRAAKRWRQLAQSYAIAPFWMMICSSFSRQCSLGVGGLGASSPSPFKRNIVKVAIEVSARARSPVVASMARRMTAPGSAPMGTTWTALTTAV